MSVENFREIFRTPGVHQDDEASEFDWGPGNVPFKGATIAQGGPYCGLSPETVSKRKNSRY